jgi:hypothetical protein
MHSFFLIPRKIFFAGNIKNSIRYTGTSLNRDLLKFSLKPEGLISLTGIDLQAFFASVPPCSSSGNPSNRELYTGMQLVFGFFPT